MKKKKIEAMSKEMEEKAALDAQNKLAAAKKAAVQGAPIAEAVEAVPKPSVSDKEQAKALDTEKVAADAAREKEVEAASK